MKTPLRVYLNNRFVGGLVKETTGTLSFKYDEQWLCSSDAFPVSMSLPLREDPFSGPRVIAVIENLLPDSDEIRRRLAIQVGAEGADAYSLLFQIGRDCVGALQFVPDDIVLRSGTTVTGEPIDEQTIECLLRNLARQPLGLDRNSEFRIAIPGTQEKTALLYHQGRWWKPQGTTPSTQILKTQIGTLQNGVDFSNSVENEFYCLKLVAAFGLPTAAAAIKKFGDTTALVIERFDRRWEDDGSLSRIPQEDFCQALSVAPAMKYQNNGGPSIVDGLKLLAGSDTPTEHQKTFLRAQIIFWLIGATDGHAKNFSIFLGPRGRLGVTPIYDVLTSQPSLACRRVERKQMKLAMSVGDSRHYRIDEIKGRHFIQTAKRAGVSEALAREALIEIAESADSAIAQVEARLPWGFPEFIHASVKASVTARLNAISM